MDPKKKWEELLKWANESPENKKAAILSAAQFIALLNAGKNFTKDELDELFGGKKKCSDAVECPPAPIFGCGYPPSSWICG